MAQAQLSLLPLLCYELALLYLKLYLKEASPMHGNILSITAAIVLWVVAAAAGSLLSAAAAEAAEPGANLEVFVSIPPQANFVKAIGGANLDVSVMVEPGKSPASYEPSPRQMVALSDAEIYFAVGVPFEKAWLEKFASANPRMRIIHTDAGVEKRPIDRHGRDARAHGHHHEGAMDPHIWLSPPLVLLQARHIMRALVDADPARKKDYEKGFRAFTEKAIELDIRLINRFSGKKPSFMVFHPSWGYFADAYGLVQIPIEVEGKEPKAKGVQNLIETARKNRIDNIFVQPQFSSKQARIIAREIGAELVSADPLAKEWAQNLERMAEAIQSYDK
jgi:zinc transport system substrate-binding protein